jgi:hypothetical protein
MSEPEDDEIGRLIRSAGRRPAIPAPDLAGIEEAARSTWREMVTTERRRRLRRRGAWALAASALLVPLGAWWWLAGRPSRAPEEIATVELSNGRTEAVPAPGRRPGGSSEIRVGEHLSAGDALATGSPGRVALRMAGGQSVRLDEGTLARLLSSSRLTLERGALYVDSGRSGPGHAGLEISTPRGVVTEIGTQYEVRLEADADAVHVRVREGSVSVLRGGESHPAARGESLTLRADGSVARGAVEPDAAEWRWVLAAAPSLDIEGRTLHSFLDWVARETGWEVRYADEALERSARGIRLHGTIEGLRPDESLGVILQGSGLDYDAEDGVVVVRR